MTKSVRDTFGKVFGTTAQLLEMRVVYDVSHNIAKEETHVVDGKEMRVLVHRKGATRAFGPGHEEIPEKYRAIGQPVLVGGSMGTCSYVLTVETVPQPPLQPLQGRAMSRTRAMRELDSSEVMKQVKAHGVSARVASKRLVAEEAPASYKDVSAVVDTCHAADISRKCVRLRPVICIKG
ncbi:tRNA-splicing ligase [Baffinella frigidus]|nr:tRNA-splicing ligase [Cryptophyta sp. CCMP2293]